MKDKLDILFELVKKNHQPNSYQCPYESLLYPVSSNNEAFMFLYESMPEDVRPNLSTCSKHFRAIFLSVLVKLNEKTFNNYFFSGMHELYNAEELRGLHFNLPDNKQLKQYWKSKENPANIDTVVDFLAKLWANNADYYPEMLEKYLPKLKKLEKITSSKSRAAEYFADWSRLMIIREGLPHFFNFCEKIGLEPVSFCRNTKQKLAMDIHAMSQRDLEFLVNYGDKLIQSNKKPQLKYSFEAVEAACYYFQGVPQIINALISLSKSKNPDLTKLSYIWSTQKDYIKYSLKKLVSKITYTDLSNKSMSIPVLINEINKNAFDYPNWSSILQIKQDEFNNMIKLASIAELEKELPVNEEPNKKKLKL
jgi:hypothetical protein